ncbi:MAG: sigma-70 family RNA polymerase sigma factor, partial [Actinomycetes bacterium]
MNERGFKTNRDTGRYGALLPRRRSGPVPRQAAHGQGLVEELVTGQMPRLLAVARRYSLCSDDAYDACQRGIEILIRRVDSLEPETADAWLRTVVKHEAMAVRAERLKGVATTADSLDGLVDSSRVDQSVDLIERLRVASEALGRLKVHEAEALRLRAQGLTYNEIADLRGWSYTKVNRLVTEGRRAFRQRVSAIDSGAQCREILEALNDGTAGRTLSREMVETHLARCQACRLEARDDLRGAAPLAIALPLLAAGVGRLASSVHAAGSWSGERALSLGTRAQVWLEAVSTGKAAAVAASAVAIAGGGAAITTGSTHRHVPVV